LADLNRPGDAVGIVEVDTALGEVAFEADGGGLSIDIDSGEDDEKLRPLGAGGRFQRLHLVAGDDFGAIDNLEAEKKDLAG
jgi:hypothetical protein